MWEKIDEFTERLWVPSGWLVRSSYVHTSPQGISDCCHQVYVPDELHVWKIESLIAAKDALMPKN